MNAAARLVHQKALSHHLVSTHIFSKSQMMILMFAFAVLISALSIIYVKNSSRMLYADYQQALHLRNQLYVERSQLLLEQGALQMQARVQQEAERKLQMQVPNQDEFVAVRE